MKYKGFVISPVYVAGSDFRMMKDGTVLHRKQTSRDIDYYEILDPMEDMERWIAEDTIEDCKATIDAFLICINMKDNTKKSWDALDS